MHHGGFTIVELLIVIVVIAILAAITAVAFNGIRQRAQVTTMQSDLKNASKQMELVNGEAGTYPTVMPSSVNPSPNVVLSLSQASSGYCINAEMTNSTSLRWYYDSANGGMREGTCSGAVISGSESGVNPNLITNTDFSSGWSLNFQTTTGRTLTTRPGAAGDPYPSRPVLVLANTGTAATTWAVLQSTGVNRPAVTSGLNYTRSVYVRKTGPFNSSFPAPGLLDGNGLNSTLSHNMNYMTITDNWQQMSATSAALQNAPASNVLYFALGTSQFTTSGWTLEFQDFQLRQQ